MKKSIFILLIGFVPFFLNAQPYSNKDKALIAMRVDSLMAKYMQKSTLAEIGSSKQSLKVIREFKKLFDPKAIVFDDMNAEYVESEKEYPYQLSNKSVNEFFDGLIEQFSQGIIVNNRNININYNNIDQGEITVALERSISGVKSTGKYSIVNEDTLSIKIKVQPDKSVLIAGITAIGSNVKVINDKDLDGVVDQSDDCPELKGKLTFMGCPDSDGDGIRDKDDECPDQIGTSQNRGCPASTFAYRYVFSASAGTMFSLNSIESIQLAELEYRQVQTNPELSRTASRQNINPDFEVGFNFLNAQIGYYFGRKKFKKNIGVSIGVAWSRYVATYDLSGSQYYFQDDDLTYMRRVRLNQALEKSTFHQLNIPLMLRYKGKLSPKLAIEGSLGASFILFSSKVQSLQSKTDFEAIMQQGSDNQYTKYDPSYTWTSSDLILIEDSININLFMNEPDPNSPNDTANAAALFESLKGFNLENDNNRSKPSSKTGIRNWWAVNAGLDFFYHVKPKIAIKIGTTVTFSPNIKRTTGSYGSIKRAGDTYDSIFNSDARSTYIGFGINIGIIMGI